MVIAENGTAPREKIGIIKMALRGRYLPRIDPSSADPFVACLRAVALSDVPALRTHLKPEFLSRSTQTGTTLLIKVCASLPSPSSPPSFESNFSLSACCSIPCHMLMPGMHGGQPGGGAGADGGGGRPESGQGRWRHAAHHRWSVLCPMS